MFKFFKNLFKDNSLPCGQMNKSLNPGFSSYFDQWDDDIDKRPGYL